MLEGDCTLEFLKFEDEEGQWVWCRLTVDFAGYCLCSCIFVLLTTVYGKDNGSCLKYCKYFEHRYHQSKNL